MFVSFLLEDKIKTAVKESTKEVETRYKGRSSIPEGILEQLIIDKFDTINFFQDHEIDPCVVELHDVKLTYLTLPSFEDILSYRYKSRIGFTMAALGQPIIPKRFITPGSSIGTSIASKYLSKVFPQRLSKKIIPSTIKILGKKTLVPSALRTVVIGRLLGRLVPYVGWTLVGIDLLEIMYDVIEIDKNKSIYGGDFFYGNGDNYY